MKLIVGLGNFGDKYAYTYHNMGFLAVQCLADRLKVRLDRRQCDSWTAEYYHAGAKHILALPLTYMNNSGLAVRQLMARYDITPADLIVVFDDIDIERGKLRIRASGSAGTHNGMRSVIEHIGSTEFARVRIGIGQPPQMVPLADYVLSNVPRDQRPQMAQAIEAAADALQEMLAADTQKQE